MKIKFLEEVLVPSFGPRLGLTNDAERDIWLKKRSHSRGITRWEREELMILFNTINSLEEAKAELEKAKEELKRREEREFLLQQQRAAGI